MTSGLSTSPLPPARCCSTGERGWEWGTEGGTGKTGRQYVVLRFQCLLVTAKQSPCLDTPVFSPSCPPCPAEAGDECGAGRVPGPEPRLIHHTQSAAEDYSSLQHGGEAGEEKKHLKSLWREAAPALGTSALWLLQGLFAPSQTARQVVLGGCHACGRGGGGGCQRRWRRWQLPIAGWYLNLPLAYRRTSPAWHRLLSSYLGEQLFLPYARL